MLHSLWSLSFLTISCSVELLLFCSFCLCLAFWMPFSNNWWSLVAHLILNWTSTCWMESLCGGRFCPLVGCILEQTSSLPAFLFQVTLNANITGLFIFSRESFFNQLHVGELSKPDCLHSNAGQEKWMGVYQSRSRFSIILPVFWFHASLLYSVPSVPSSELTHSCLLKIILPISCLIWHLYCTECG